MTDETPLATFMVLSDPQFGMYAHFAARQEEARPRLARVEVRLPHLPAIEGLEREERLFGEAIAAANELRPDFVVVCGDMIHHWDDAAEIEAVRRIAGDLDASIPLHWVAGNHDTAADSDHPRIEDIERYRELYGADRYAFDAGAVRVLVVNSSVLAFPEQVPEEQNATLAFLRDELGAATRAGRPAIVCSHHPWFRHRPDEDESTPGAAMIMAPERRCEVLQAVAGTSLVAVISGHLHRNVEGQGDGFVQLTTTAVGLPLGEDPSGYRIVRVFADRVESETHALSSGVVYAEESERLRAEREAAE